ncbi:hypothetical protein [Streptomyces sp. NPDC088270]|uniref:hypothetical protein n=1 Tax=Streptomyces sp. NPDC088270 TaxID=3160990 RepID=UPI00342B52C9
MLDVMFDPREMRLIHVHIRTPRHFVAFDPMPETFKSFAASGERVEHVSVHTAPPEGLTVGFYIVAETLSAAERVAQSVAERAVRGHTGLEGCQVVSCSAALVGKYFDCLLDGIEPDGRFMRGPHEDTERP